MSDIIVFDITTGNIDERDYTTEELVAISARQPTANDLIMQQIADLESTVTERRYREAVLGIDNGWLKDLNDDIASLRVQLKQ